MNLSAIKKISLVLFIFFTLISCEKETNVNYSIDNQSSEKINVLGTDIINSLSIDLAIDSLQNKSIATWTKLGKETDYYEPTTMFGDDLLITNSSGDTLIKDYTLLSNWKKNVQNKRSTANHEYKLTITDSDF